MLVAVGICWASTELSGSDETAERVSPGRHQTTHSRVERRAQCAFLSLLTVMHYIQSPAVFYTNSFSFFTQKDTHTVFGGHVSQHYSD